MAAGVGPGPFTGLRVGLVTARTLGLALGIPVSGGSILDVLATTPESERHDMVAGEVRRIVAAVFDTDPDTLAPSASARSAAGTGVGLLRSSKRIPV